MKISENDMTALIARLRKRADIDRECAKNSEVVVALLKPQMDLFEKRESGGWNTYAVRMAVDHENSARKDNQYAEDLETVLALLDTLCPKEITLTPYPWSVEIDWGTWASAREIQKKENDIRVWLTEKFGHDGFCYIIPDTFLSIDKKSFVFRLKTEEDAVLTKIRWS